MPIICAGRNCGACGKNYTSRLSVFGVFFCAFVNPAMRITHTTILTQNFKV